MNVLFRAFSSDAYVFAERVARLEEALTREMLANSPCYGFAKETRIGIYHCLPWLSGDVFDEVPEAVYDAIGAAGLLYSRYLLTVDALVDGDRAPKLEEIVSAGMLHEKALTHLANALSGYSVNLECLHSYHREYACAILHEQFIRQKGVFGDVSDDILRQIAIGKSALLKASPALLSHVSSRQECLRDLEIILDAFGFANQMQDDLRDWRDDLLCGQPSLLLCHAYRVCGAGDRSPERIANLLYYEGVATRVLGYAIDACRGAQETALRIGALRWHNAVMLLCAQLEEATETCRRETERAYSASVPVDRAKLELALYHGSRYLLEQLDDGLRSGTHRMTFPRSLGFGGSSEDHEGSVYIRATVLFALSRVKRLGAAIPQESLDRARQDLLDLRRPGEVVWSYFPSLPDLPADLDDTAQAILALAPSEHTLVREAVAKASRVLQAELARYDGLAQTWLPDCAAIMADAVRQRNAVERHWGRGVDTDVIANGLYALFEVGNGSDPAINLTAQIRSALNWLIAHRDPAGFWQSTWYVGPYYGTWIVCRTLRVYGMFSHHAHESALETVAWIRGQQRADGGFAGNGARSDALSTALALLAAFECCPDLDRQSHWVERATAFLWLAQSLNGSWAAAPWIQMQLNRATASSKLEKSVITHGSRDATTAFALMAIVSVVGSDSAALPRSLSFADILVHTVVR